MTRLNSFFLALLAATTALIVASAAGHTGTNNADAQGRSPSGVTAVAPGK